jgi:hypothetical protein
MSNFIKLIRLFRSFGHASTVLAASVATFLAVVAPFVTLLAPVVAFLLPVGDFLVVKAFFFATFLAGGVFNTSKLS